MPSYIDVKLATILLINQYSYNHEIYVGYGKPVDEPRYSAITKLSVIGINAYVRRAMMKPTNSYMRDKFPDAWRAVGVSELVGVDTIGGFIKLMCSCNSIAVPNKEPT